VVAVVVAVGVVVGVAVGVGVVVAVAVVVGVVVGEKSMSGKYRWMTVDEAEEELPPGTAVWVRKEPGEALSIATIGGIGYLQFLGWSIDIMRCPGAWRVCRALVPEVPRIGEP
jgi:hypothetical protein